MRNETLGYYLKKTIFLALLCLMLIVPMISVPSKGGDENRFFFSRDIKTLNNWSEDAQLTNLSTIDRWVADPVIVASGNFAHIIYCEVWQPGISFRRDLRYLGSSDKGKTWSTVVNLTETNFYATYPDTALYNDNIYVTWQDYRDHPGHSEIYFKNSSDNGEHWSNDTALTSNDGYASEKPNIFVVNNSIYVVWEDTRYGNCEIYFRKGLVQENGTITWESEKRVTTTSINTGNWNPCIYITNATIHLVFHRYLEDTGKTEIFYMNSVDEGENWSLSQLLSTKDTYHSAYAKIGIYGSIIHVVWQETKDGNMNIYYRNSTDSGNSWNPEVRLTNTTGDEYDPHVTVNGSWVWVSWWSTGDNCGHYRLSKDNGITWEDPVQLTTQSGTPILAVSDSYVHAVFTSDRTGNSEIYYKRHPKFNDPPEINEWYPQTNVTITELQNQLFYVNATDANNDTLFYQWYLNDSLLVNETNSSYLFVPDENSSGNYTIKVVVSDGDLTTNHTWSITVINIKKLQAEINDLQDPLEQLNENYTELLNTLTQLGENLSLIWSQLNSSELNNTEIQNKLQGLNENLTALKNQMVLSDQNTTIIQDLIGSLNQTLNLSNEQITGLWGMLNQSMANETNFRNLIAQLNQSINSLQDELDKLKEENKQIVREREVAEERLMIAAVVLVGLILICVLMGIAKRKR